MARFLLLNPPADSGYVKEGRCQHRSAVFSSVYPPMTLAYMASFLRDKNDVRIIDAIGSRMTIENVLVEISSYKPDYIVCNTTTPTFKNDLGIFDEIKKVHECMLVVYGVHVSCLWAETLEHESIDIVVIGEPEESVSELSEKKLSQIQGIAYWEDGTKVKNEAREFMDLRRLPLPSWDLVDLSNYKVPIMGGKYVLVTTGRGCPFSCSFCVSQPYYGLKNRKRPIKDVIDEIKYAKELGVCDFFFFAETFTLDKEYVHGLCDKILSEGLSIRWFCNSRVDTVDADLLRKMRSCGCWMISFGIESADQGILDSCSKGTTVNQAKKAVEAAYSSGMAVVGHFVVGLPGETQKTIDETMRFSLNLPLTFAEYYIFTPFPGSALFEGLKASISGDWSSFEYSKNLVSKDIDLESVRKKAYRSFYLRPKTFFMAISIFGLKRIPILFINGLKFILNI
jgi:anaerobic magnesium-protoporphyrin IX monomethyl ester cyclase